MLDSLEAAGKRASDVAELGVVVVDDNPDRSALTVVEESERDFPLGIHYRWTGSGNIATARNAGIEASMELADWVAMVDDDQVVVPEWLSELMRIIEEQDAEAVTAPVYVRFPEGAPRWIVQQPFADLWGTEVKPDGSAVTDLQTANSIISTAFLKNHPEIRFSSDLGEVGGEDMVFYRRALDAGLRAHYSLNAVNWEIEPIERASYRYQLRRNLWHGNTEAVTCLRAGRDGRVRLVARAVKRLAGAGAHSVGRVRRGRSPHLRFLAAYSLQSVGLVLGAFGMRLSHS